MKTAIVLGSSRGVGAAIRAALLCAGLSAPEYSRKQIDTASDESVRRFIYSHPSTDVLVLNTGGPPRKNFFAVKREEWEQYHQQLFLSFVTLLQQVQVHEGGFIFLISSHLISEPKPDMTLSVAYRLALWSVLKALSKQFAERKVSVINLALGPILTDRLKDLAGDLDALADRQPMKRVGTPEEIGAFVRAIVTGNIKCLSGVTITFDGALSTSLL